MAKTVKPLKRHPSWFSPDGLTCNLPNRPLTAPERRYLSEEADFYADLIGFDCIQIKRHAEWICNGIDKGASADALNVITGSIEVLKSNCRQNIQCLQNIVTCVENDWRQRRRVG